MATGDFFRKHPGQFLSVFKTQPNRLWDIRETDTPADKND